MLQGMIRSVLGGCELKKIGEETSEQLNITPVKIKYEDIYPKALLKYTYFNGGKL